MANKVEYTTTPLNSGSVYLGRYTEIQNYNCAIISILSDTTATITSYQFIDKNRTVNTVFEYEAGDVGNVKTFYINPILLPYIYFTVHNNSLNNQTYLNFLVKYIYESLEDDLGSNVNITNPFLEVKQYSGNVFNVSDTNIYNILNTRGTATLNNGAILPLQISSSVNLSNKKISNLTIYGTQDGLANELYIMFSNDGTTFYKSQYAFIFGTGLSGDFGFNLSGCVPRYIAIQSKDGCNLTAYIDYC
jgi:hypothetical protein